MLKSSEFKNNYYYRISVLAILTTFLWFISFLLGLVFNWGLNNLCYKYLGCNSGFFGYDVVEYFLFGIAAVFVLVWIFKKFPKYSMLYNIKNWKNIIILIILVVFITLMWEFLKFAHDFFITYILHQQLFNFRIHINYLAQPSNLNLMGNLAFSILGSMIALFFVRN